MKALQIENAKKRVLLLSNQVLHYREKVYRYFSKRFEEDGYEFIVASDRFASDLEGIGFNAVAMNSLLEWKRLFADMQPDAVILYLHLKDPCFFPALHYCKRHHIPVTYWGYGVNVLDPYNPIKKMLFRRIGVLSDSIITYSSQTRCNFGRDLQEKIFVARNTVDYSDVDRSAYSAKTARLKYGITEPHILLCVATLKPSKKVDTLIRLFSNTSDVAVVIAGSGPEEEKIKASATADNVYLLGAKYDEDIHELFAAADVFTIPGNVGLAINESMFWGVPLVTLDGPEGAEIGYMKLGVTGYVEPDEAHYKERILSLLFDKGKRDEMSSACVRAYEEEISIARMYEGYLEAVKYAVSKLAVS